MSAAQFFCMGAAAPESSVMDNVTDLTERRIARLLAYNKDRDDREFTDAMRRAAERVQEAS